MTRQENITITLEEYQEYQKQKDEIIWLKHQLSELKRMIFGSKRERFISNQDELQLALFDLPQLEDNQEAETEEISYTRKKAGDKKQPLRTELPSHLPRKEEVIEPENIPEGAKKIGEVVTEILEYTPADIYVRKIIRPKYIVSSTDEKTEISIATLPSLPIPKSNAGAGILAHIIVSKYVDHLPFYRQRQIFKRKGLHIAESTMNGWFNASAKLIERLYNALKSEILQTDYLMADETPIPVLTKDKPGSTHKGFHWVYYDPVRRLVLFDYRKTRSREGPDEILENFSGYLQTDGYTAYTNLKNAENITLLACMAHARRKFEKAKDNNKKLSEQMLGMIQKLYEIERKAKESNMDFEQIEQLRQKESVKILNKMKEWLDENIYQVPPQSVIGKAMAYTLNLWPRLIRYTEQGRFRIDNNLVENSIRPVALGRKNYLFAGSHQAAEKAAMFYSLLATCKINNVEPYQWLKETFEKINTGPADKIYQLLPGYENDEV